MRKIRSNSVAAKLVEGVKNGEEKTVSQWAKVLKVRSDHIRAALTSLRKRGYLFYPIGTINGFNGESQEGKILDIADSLQTTKSTVNRYHQNHLKPNLTAMFTLIIESVQNFPQLTTTVQQLTEQTLFKVLEAKQQISEQPLPLKSGK